MTNVMKTEAEKSAARCSCRFDLHNLSVKMLSALGNTKLTKGLKLRF